MSQSRPVGTRQPTTSTAPPAPLAASAAPVVPSAAPVAPTKSLALLFAVVPPNVDETPKGLLDCCGLEESHEHLDLAVEILKRDPASRPTPRAKERA